MASGKLKGAVTSVLIFFIIGGGVLAFAKANNITDFATGIDFVKGKSKQVKECYGDPKEWVEWNCKPPTDGELPPVKDGVSDLPPINNAEVPTFNINKPTESSLPKELVEPYVQKLNTVKVSEAKEIDYDRSEWNHWLGSRCDTVREQVLREQAKDFTKDSSNCKVEAGSWLDPYGRGELTKPNQIDIDHVVSLGYAARHGGQDWAKDKKEAFANDRLHLLATSASENRSKSDKGPSEWMPKNKEMHCTFSVIYTDTVVKYGLSITPKDKIALEKGLKTC